MPELSRLQKLEILADVWLKVYLFHPALVTDDVDWHGLALTVLPQVEQAGTVDELIPALNQLLAPLHDPLTRIERHTPAVQVPSGRLYKRQHRGWHESAQPYIYQQSWIADDTPTAPHLSCYFDRLTLALNPYTAQPAAMHFPASSAVTPELSREQRLLGLFKTFGVLRYFAPNFAASSVCLADWILQVEAVEDLAAYCDVLRALAAPLNDQHVQVVYPQGTDEDETAAKTYSCLPAVMKHTRRLADNIGYMTPFTMPSARILEQAFQSLQDTRALILDLRGYPKVHFKHALIQYLCDYPVESPCYHIPVINHPDLSRRTWQHIQHTIEPATDGQVYRQPVIALIDDSVQSAAEDVVMHLKNARRVLLVGRATVGCQGNAAFIELPGGGWLSFTGMQVTDAAGRNIQNMSITPDISVPQNQQKSAEDEVLRRGIEGIYYLYSEVRPPFRSRASRPHQG